MKRIQGRIATDGIIAGDAVYRVRAIVDGTGEGAAPVAIDIPVSGDGKFSVAMPPELASSITTGRLEIIGLDGALLLTHELDTTGRAAELKIEAPATAFETRRVPPGSGKKAQRIAGRLLDSSGGPVGAATVLVHGQPAGAPAPAPIADAKTDAKGYFEFLAPVGALESAHAMVYAGAAAETLQIVLKGGRIPLRLVLVLSRTPAARGQAPATPRDPSASALSSASGVYAQDLGTGGCVELSTPDRTVEEFRFQYLVRTTDPQVQRVSGLPFTTLPAGTKPLKNSGIKPKFSFGRLGLDGNHQIEWDGGIETVQAITIAHGHVLTLAYEWMPDGYSLGDLVYSLPLAPCQKKRVAILDWRRRDSAARSEALDATDSVQASIEHERAILETVNVALEEKLKGASVGAVYGSGAGAGAAGSYQMITGVAGAASGLGVAGSAAWQQGSRDLFSQAQQTITDAIRQAATSVRSQRATVVQEVNQDESVRIETEVIANHNHCHALTIEYFEVLKHYLVRNHLVEVRECLFVPLPMAKFEREKALRWANILRPVLLDQRLAGGFDASARIAAGWQDSNLPTGAYCDADIVEIIGGLTIELSLPVPPDPEEMDKPAWLKAIVAWGRIYLALQTFGVSELVAAFVRMVKDAGSIDQKEYAKLAAEVRKRIAKHIIVGVLDGTRDGSQTEMDISFAGGLDGAQDRMQAALRIVPARRLTRREFAGLVFTLDRKLPNGIVLYIRGAQFDYRSSFAQHTLVRPRALAEDLSKGDPARIPGDPLSAAELRDPRDEDRERERALIAHLDAQLEYYHRAIWLAMDPARRYMLLDGFLAPRADTGTPQRSLASVLENRLLGIVGNCLIMPVVPGLNLDPVYRWDTEKGASALVALYSDVDEVEPIRLALPQSGVFAEAVLGKCNSCEPIDDSRFWRWEESPCPDDAPEIAPIGAESRRADPGNLAAQPFAAPIVNLQQAPSVPDPTGMAQAMQLLAGLGAFRDVTGLAANQSNALAAYTTAQETVRKLASEAAGMWKQLNTRDLDRVTSQIKAAEADGALKPDESAALRKAAIENTIGPAPMPAPGLTPAPAAVPPTSTTGPGVPPVSSGPGGGLPPGDDSTLIVEPPSEPAPADASDIDAYELLWSMWQVVRAVHAELAARTGISPSLCGLAQISGRITVKLTDAGTPLDLGASGNGDFNLCIFATPEGYGISIDGKEGQEVAFAPSVKLAKLGGFTRIEGALGVTYTLPSIWWGALDMVLSAAPDVMETGLRELLAWAGYPTRSIQPEYRIRGSVTPGLRFEAGLGLLAKVVADIGLRPELELKVKAPTDLAEGLVTVSGMLGALGRVTLGGDAFGTLFDGTLSASVAARLVIRLPKIGGGTVTGDDFVDVIAAYSGTLDLKEVNEVFGEKLDALVEVTLRAPDLQRLRQGQWTEAVPFESVKLTLTGIGRVAPYAPLSTLMPALAVAGIEARLRAGTEVSLGIEVTLTRAHIENALLTNASTVQGLYLACVAGFRNGNPSTAAHAVLALLVQHALAQAGNIRDASITAVAKLSWPASESIKFRTPASEDISGGEIGAALTLTQSTTTKFAFKPEDADKLRAFAVNFVLP